MYQIVFSSQAQKDAKKIKSAALKNNVLTLIEIVRQNPYQNPPPYEKLLGALRGCYSRRINIQHRFIYQIYENEKVIKIIRMWTHYE